MTSYTRDLLAIASTWTIAISAPLLLAATCKVPEPTPTPATGGGGGTGGSVQVDAGNTGGNGAEASGGTVAECHYLSSRASVARQVTSRVVGGIPAPPGSAPWIGALMVGGHQFCAGTVIDDTWALTAAHCQVETTDDLLVGTQDITSGGRRVGIAEVRNHWQWTSTTSGHDVAVLRLEEPAGVEPIELESMPYDTGTALVLGWGRTSEGGSSSSVLLQARVPIVPWAQCWQAYPLALDETMVCAGGDGVDSCQADSGGPLTRDGKQIGIVSFGRGCARPGFPGVYTLIPSVLEWIEACAQ